MPKRFVGAKLPSGINPKISNYFKHLDDEWDRGRGLMLTGPPGRGKTYLACALMQHAEPKYKTMFTTLPQLMRFMGEIFTASNKHDWDEHERLIKTLRKLRSKIDFLVVDDVGKEYRTTSGFAESELDYLLRRRYDLALPTIVTTNLTLDDWGEIYSESMASFIHEAFVIVPIVGKDRRNP